MDEIRKQRLIVGWLSMLMDLISAVAASWLGFMFILHLIGWMIAMIYMRLNAPTARFTGRLWIYYIMVTLTTIEVLFIIAPVWGTSRSIWAPYTGWARNGYYDSNQSRYIERFVGDDRLVWLFWSILLGSQLFGLVLKLKWFQLEYEVLVSHGQLASRELLDLLNAPAYAAHQTRSRRTALALVIFTALGFLYYLLMAIPYAMNETLTTFLFTALPLNTVLFGCALAQLYSTVTVYRTDIGKLSSYVGMFFSIYLLAEAFTFGGVGGGCYIYTDTNWWYYNRTPCEGPLVAPGLAWITIAYAALIFITQIVWARFSGKLRGLIETGLRIAVAAGRAEEAAMGHLAPVAPAQPRHIPPPVILPRENAALYAPASIYDDHHVVEVQPMPVPMPAMVPPAPVIVAAYSNPATAGIYRNDIEG